jgi:hypothetical protein
LKPREPPGGLDAWRKAFHTTPEQAAAGAEKRAAAERERAAINRALGPQPVVIIVPAKDAQPIASAAPILESAAAAGAAALRNKGGRPDVWDWPRLIPTLKEETRPFDTMADFEELVRENARRVDGKPRGKGPKIEHVRAAIKRHRLDQYVMIRRP